MPINSSCDRTQTLHGWEITLIHPMSTSGVSSKVFQYDIVRVEDSSTSEQIDNILICLCPDITDKEREGLLSSCCYTVYYDNGICNTISDCSIDNTVPPPDVNPAECKGLRFNNIPPGEGDAEQTHILVNLVLTEALSVGPVDIGFKAGPSATSGVWEGICGPICRPVIPPTRGIIL